MLSTNSGYNMLNRYQWKCKIAFRDIFNSVFKVCKWGMDNMITGWTESGSGSVLFPYISSLHNKIVK